MIPPMKWLGAGALVSFGIVGFLTGLVLLPFGVALAFSAARTRPSAWPWFLVGLGIGPVALLGRDVAGADPATGAVAAYWLGAALVASGVALSVLTNRRPSRTPPR